MVSRIILTLTSVVTLGMSLWVHSATVRAQVAAQAAEAQGAIDLRPDFKIYFDEIGTIGTIAVREIGSGRTTVYNPDRARERFAPASTFKIPHSLIALQLGAIRDPRADVIKWNGVKTTDAWWHIPGCDEDVTLARAFRLSCVPAYQSFTNKIGTERYNLWLNKIAYGSADISGAPLNEFWLEGNLTISALEQLDFLERLFTGKLPFDSTVQQEFIDIMIIDRTPDYVLRAKTGWSKQVKPEIGWWVGLVERGQKVYVFATNLEVRDRSHLKARMDITRRALTSLGVL